MQTYLKLISSPTFQLPCLCVCSRSCIATADQAMLLDACSRMHITAVAWYVAQHLVTHFTHLSACSQTCVFCGDLSVWDGAEEMEDNDNEAMDLFENLNAAMAGK